MPLVGIERGTLWFADLGSIPYDRVTHVTLGRRPVVVLSVDLEGRTCVVVPCSSRTKQFHGRCGHLVIQEGVCGLSVNTCVMCEQVRVLDTKYMLSCIGYLPKKQMRRIEKSILAVLGLSRQMEDFE